MRNISQLTLNFNENLWILHPELALADSLIDQEVLPVDLIKIDTDGSELKVLKGSYRIIESFRPIIIFEVGAYLMNENNTTFNDYYAFLKPFGYLMINSKNKRQITPNNFHHHIPRRSTIDIIAIPSTRL